MVWLGGKQFYGAIIIHLRDALSALEKIRAQIDMVTLNVWANEDTQKGE